MKAAKKGLILAAGILQLVTSVVLVFCSLIIGLGYGIVEFENTRVDIAQAIADFYNVPQSVLLIVSIIMAVFAVVSGVLLVVYACKKKDIQKIQWCYLTGTVLSVLTAFFFRVPALLLIISFCFVNISTANKQNSVNVAMAEAVVMTGQSVTATDLKKIAAKSQPSSKPAQEVDNNIKEYIITLKKLRDNDVITQQEYEKMLIDCLK